MKVKFDRSRCAGWFQCIQDWDAFKMNVLDGKADLVGGKEIEEDVLIREVPDDLKEEAKSAAESCPVDAIEIHSDGDRLSPPD